MSMDADEADRLVEEVQSGRTESFRPLFLGFERQVRMYLSSHASCVDVVDEVLQATFVTCFERINSYERRGTFLFWLKGIARNRLYKELQVRSRHAHQGGDMLDKLLAQTAVEVFERSDGGMDGASLRRCLERITPKIRDLLYQRYVEGQAVKALALSMSRTESWVSVTLHRTRALLRQCLAQSETST